MKKNVGLIRLTDHSVRDSCCCNFKRLSTISIFWLNTISLTAPLGLTKGRISQGLVWMLWSISYVHVWFSVFFCFFGCVGGGLFLVVDQWLWLKWVLLSLLWRKRMEQTHFATIYPLVKWDLVRDSYHGPCELSLHGFTVTEHV